MCSSSKYYLIVLNVFFLILSFVFITIGVIIQTILAANFTFLSEHLAPPAAVMLTFGILIFSASLLGLFSVSCRSQYLLWIYICFLVILIVVEFFQVISGLVAKSHVLRLILDSLRAAQSKYTRDYPASFTWDSIQRDLKCCGVSDVQEWSPHLHNKSLPDSCCTLYIINCGKTALETGNFYQSGCIGAISQWVDRLQIIIGVSVCIIIILQLQSLACSRGYLKVLQCYGSAKG